MNTHDIKLPPLPEPTYRSPSGTGNYFDGYTKQTLQDYARTAIEADRQARSEPVAEVTVNRDRSQTWIALKTQWLPEGKHLLYTAPQPQQIPEGYKLVPIEPTEEMLECVWGRSKSVYKAMLEAAPKVKP